MRVSDVTARSRQESASQSLCASLLNWLLLREPQRREPLAAIGDREGSYL